MRHFCPLLLVVTATSLEDSRYYLLADGSELLVAEFNLSQNESGLGEFLGTVSKFEGSLVRGRWKESVWGAKPVSVRPPGSSMILQSSPLRWTQLAWLLSSSLGGAFESLLPEQRSFSWNTPVDLQDVVRVGSNPNEPCCLEHMDRFFRLLPSRGRNGLGLILATQLTDIFASSQLVTLGIKGASGQLTLSMQIHLDRNKLNTVHRVLPRKVAPKSTHNFQVSRSLVGSGKPERMEGRLELNFFNPDLTNPVTITYYEQLPYFLVPLWSTSTGHVPIAITASDGIESPTYFTLSVHLDPGEEKQWTVKVAKKFVATNRFSFSFEKGFDLSSAVWTHDRDPADIQLTRGLVVVIPLPDATATFNMIAISCTALALFYGSVFRNYLSKRSLLRSGTPQATGLLENVFALVHKLFRKFVS